MIVATFRIRKEDVEPIFEKANELNKTPSSFLRDIVLLGFQTYSADPDLIPPVGVHTYGEDPDLISPDPEPEPVLDPEPEPVLDPEPVANVDPEKQAFWKFWKRETSSNG